MAARPADGLWLAIARLNDSSRCARPDEAMLLQHKRQTVARLSRLLLHPLPLAVSGEAQMSFWAGYCAYWNEIRNAHIGRADELAS